MNRLFLFLICACTASDSFKDSVTDTATLQDSVHLDPGTFTIGCTAAQQPYCEQIEEGPVHTVTLTRGFFMDKKEVTQAEFETRMGFKPSENPNCDDCPVEQIHFQQAMEMANARSRSDGWGVCYTCNATGCLAVDNLLDCDGYRLPTNAEWEYAARCGTDQIFSGSDTAFEVAWTAHSAAGRTHPGGELLPNACGLFDLSGNVWEMVHDWYNAYPSTDQTDPVGPAGGALRTLRGGAWNLEPEHARVSNRWDYLEEAGNNVGFRLVRSDMAND